MTLYGLRPVLRWTRTLAGGRRPVPSRVRRISAVAPPAERLVAITFDDGPTRGITEQVLETLERCGARGTFDIIGSTADNYPDTAGRAGTPLWSGRRYDHYAAFGRDGEAGLRAQPDLVRRIAAGGHEVSNHSYRHLAFGPEHLVYRGRHAHEGAAAALEDQRRLHDACRALLGQAPRLGRPPHYIDRTPDGWSAYDLYDAMGYQYLAASLDLGGWRRSRNSRAATVDDALAALRTQLRTDPAALSGQVLFAKDGYNMSLQPVVCWALPLQLELLAAAGYRVVTVSELLESSPFADVPPTDPAAAAARRLLAAGVPCAFRDNTLRVEGPLRRGELAAWLAGPVSPPALLGAADGRHARPDPAGMAAARGWLEPGVPGEPVARAELERSLERWEWVSSRTGAAAAPVAPGGGGGAVTRRLALARMAAALGTRCGPEWRRPGA